ncbi:hypothetical protein ACPXCE_26310 [Streptomyces sp. DT24]|uniref:hypothetical protein n=1 Tax=unclassified Streptomyces TaxID=2593676 RepID=UPI003CF42356
MRTSVRRPAVLAATLAALTTLAAIPATATTAATTIDTATVTTTAPTPSATTRTTPADPVPTRGLSVTTTPAALCGPGYTEIDSHSFRNSSTELARVHLLYNARTRTNCVVTQHAPATAGFSLPTGAWLDVRGDGKGQVKDQKDYASYAGPVRLAAAGRCVRWGGMIEAGVGTYTYTSPWEHCG